MTQDEIIRMAREAGFTGCLLPEEADNLIGGVFIDDENWAKPLERFAALVAAHEREKWEPAFNKNKPAPKIENGNVYFEAGLYTPLEVQLAIDLLEEREACAKMCEEIRGSIYVSGRSQGADFCSAAIRARGE